THIHRPSRPSKPFPNGRLAKLAPPLQSREKSHRPPNWRQYHRFAKEMHSPFRRTHTTRPPGRLQNGILRHSPKAQPKNPPSTKKRQPTERRLPVERAPPEVAKTSVVKLITVLIAVIAASR